MGMMDSMMVASAVANGVISFDLGTALWLFLVLCLVASGLGIIAKAHTGRPLDLNLARRATAVRVAAAPGQLCEAGGV